MKTRNAKQDINMDRLSWMGHIVLSIVATALLVLVAPPASFAGTFSDDFSNGLNPTNWTVTQTTTGLYTVVTTNGEIQLAKTATPSPGGIQNVTIGLNQASVGGSVTGDFSAKVNFANAVVPGPGLDQVELHTLFQDGSFFFTVYDNFSGLNVHVWNGSINGLTSVSTNAGTFGIGRSGSTLSGYFNGSLIFSEMNTAALVSVSFILQNNAGSDDATSVTYDNFSLTAASVPSPPCIAPPSGLVSWWPGDGNANDIQGGNNGILSDGTTFASGEVAQAFSFDGVDDEVVVPHNTNQNTGSQITIDAWVYPSTLGHGRSIAQKRSSANVGGYTLETTDAPFGPAHGLQWVIMIGGIWQTLQTASDALGTGAWQHVAATYDGAAMRIYVNGTESTNTPVTGGIDAVTNDFVIGRNVVVTADDWDGLIDEIELFNRAVTANEVVAIFNAGSAGKCKVATNFPPGDVNGDRHVNSADSLLINQVLVHLRGSNDAIFATAGFANGDVNQDSQVTSGDSLLINQQAVNLRSYIVTKIVPSTRSNNVPTPVTIFGIGFPTNAVSGSTIGPPVNLTLSNVEAISREQITGIVLAGGGTGTGTVNVVATPTNGVISFGRFINQ